MSTPDPEVPDRPAPAPEPELTGARVGEYVVEERVGSGAFGTVYRGVHPLIGKAVAIKVLSRRFSADPEMVSRFVAEARAVNQIRHRHIIDIFSFGQLEDGRHYYIMEYLEGETLQALLDREHRISPARCIAILRAIGRALDAAHAKGIAHRDLKAENVFLGADPDGGVWPKLLDFGIAKLTSSEDGLAHKTRSGISIGTPLYMSPEQCHGRQVDHRTDIYAFGVLLYLMLTGVFPFDGDSYMEILMQQVGTPPPPPSSHVPALPEAIDDAVLWLLHKDPAQRPPDLKTAVIVFEQAAERAGLLAAGATTQPGRASIIAVASLVAITAVVAAAVALYPRSDAAPRGAVLSPRSDAAPRGAVLSPRSDAAPRGAVLSPRSDNPATPRGAALATLTAPAQGAGGGASPPARSPPQPAAVPVVARDHAPRSPDARAPVAPRSVTVTIEGVPPGTDVLAGARRVGVAPGPIPLPYGTAPWALTFRVSGYLPAGRSIVPDRDRALTLTLVKQTSPPPPGGKRPTKDDIINVFGGDAP
jgi:eukaryotic-like serine/threonine-protein kinase